jgi:signal transduction histidine kinase
MAFTSVFSLRVPALLVLYFGSYIALDWVSFIEPLAPFGITPWNPSTGLSFVLILLFGQRFLPLLFIAPLVSNVLLRQFPLPWPLEIATDTIIGCGYAAGLLVLLRPKTLFNPALTSVRDVTLLIGVAGVSGAVVATCYVGVLVVTSVLPAADFGRATLKYWIGDVIGIAVVTPFALIAFTRGLASIATREMAAQIVAIIAALAFVFIYAEEQTFEFFYLLFLPLIWMAVRGGLETATVGILLTQIGLILCLQLLPVEGVDVASFQAIMLVLALSTLAAGAVVTEHRRSEAQLRRHQDSLARVARLGSMGELAAMVAHEINQPLMAAGTYTRLVADSLNTIEVPPSVFDTAEKAAAQVQRAADVVRQLRAFIRLDQSNRAPATIERIVNETVELYRPELDRGGVTVRLALDPRLPQVTVDLLQIEQVLLNLLRNSAEAMADAGQKAGVITIGATQQSPDRVTIEVQDNGPGFPPELLTGDLAALPSRKAEGLGIGLSLCRSIVEAHGGRLDFVNGSGATIRFTLPVTAKG